MSVLIQLERFEGPLGLLLHLIRKEEMDVFDINIHQITRQYLDYIKAMKKLDLELAGEFIAMAATLIHIKSRMLLPHYNEEGEEVEPEDPRKELVQKLIEYQKFQEISQKLYERPLLGRDIWQRGRVEDIEAEEDGEIVMEEENALFALISTYRSVIRNVKKSVHKVMTDLQSIASRILEIKDQIKTGQRTRFGALITQREKQSNQVLVTFLSLLELAKMGFVSLFQSEPYSEIYIEGRKEIDRDVTSRVEDYEGDSPEDHLSTELMNAADESLTEFVDEEVQQNEQSERQDLFSASEREEEIYDAATDEEIEAESLRIDALEAQEIQEIEPPSENRPAFESARAMEQAGQFLQEENQEVDETLGEVNDSPDRPLEDGVT